MSQFRIEKQRADAEITLATGTTVRGAFFLAASSATHAGPERIGDLLNAEAGFFPFETGPGGAGTVLVNRAHLVSVRLVGRGDEPQHDPGYAVARTRRVVMLLTDGRTLEGLVRVYCPQGRDRLSDYARSAETFRYLEARGETFVVNSGHIVTIYEAD